MGKLFQSLFLISLYIYRSWDQPSIIISGIYISMSTSTYEVPQTYHLILLHFWPKPYTLRIKKMQHVTSHYYQSCLSISGDWLAHTLLIPYVTSLSHFVKMKVSVYQNDNISHVVNLHEQYTTTCQMRI